MKTDKLINLIKMTLLLIPLLVISSEVLDINEISETKISSFRNFDEIKIDFITNDDSVYITIIK